MSNILLISKGNVEDIKLNHWRNEDEKSVSSYTSIQMQLITRVKVAGNGDYWRKQNRPIIEARTDST